MSRPPPPAAPTAAVPPSTAAVTGAVAFPPDSGPHLPPEPPEPDSEDESTVGWYPSGPAGVPTVGPFAAPVTPARRGIGSFSLFRSAHRASPPKSPASVGRPVSRNRRSTLVNVLLFGFGPLALAGIIAAAFVLVSPGKGPATSSLGFQAGPAATTQQSTQSAPTVPPSSPAAPSKPTKPSKPSKPSKQHSRATSSAGAKVPTISRTILKTKATPKPTHKSGGGAAPPRNLGLPDFAGYCQHIGDRTAELTANNAYGWHCTLNSGRVLQIASVCAWTYHLSVSQVVGVSTNYYSGTAWQCWRIHRDLGVLDVTKYCVSAGLGTSTLVAENAYGWYCTAPSAPVNTTAACDAVYYVSDAISRFAVFADPYSWQCWN
jgi:hypothetical protein